MTGHTSALESDSEKYGSDSTVQYEYSDIAEEHMKTDSQAYSCSYVGCEKTFKKRSRLRNHVLTHSGIKQYRCTHEGCTNAYTRSAHLSRHISAVHTQNKDIFLCEVEGCGKAYASRYALRKHTDRSHINTDNYKCNVAGCGETFTKRFQLRHHLFTHQGTLAFQCSVKSCGKIFQQSSHLKRHMKMHEGYTCTDENCQLRFQTWSLLRKHVSTDHKRVHICDQCGKECSTKSILRRHINVKHPTETGVALYKCTHADCTRAYPDLYNLKSHIRVSHKKELFFCKSNGCAKLFTTKQKRDEHAKTHEITSESAGAQKLKKKRTNEHRKKTIAEKLCGIVERKSASTATAVSTAATTQAINIAAVTDTVDATAKLDINER